MEATLFILLLLVAAAPAAYAVQHTVGNSAGWNQGVNYVTWAASQTFVVGDTLLFQYGPSHSVDTVSLSDYNNCNTGNPLNSSSGGTTTISITTVGPMYFICPTAGHCQSGMKLAITAVAASGPPTPSPPGSTTPSGTTSPPPPPPPPPPYSGAAGKFGFKNYVVLEISLLVVALIAFMG